MDGAFGGYSKKLIRRDPVMNLAAFYAPRGITPEQIRRMSPGDRLILWVGLERWNTHETEVINALLSPYRKEGGT